MYLIFPTSSYFLNLLTMGCHMASTYCMCAVLEQVEIKGFFLFKGTIVNTLCLIPPSGKQSVRKWPS